MPETVPFDSVNPSTPTPVLVSKEASPVGVPLPLPGATLIFTLTDWPCVIPLVGGPSVRVVAEERNVAVLHLVTRFFTFTEPSPVARS